MLSNNRVTDWLGNQTSVVLNQYLLEMFDLLIRHCRGISMMVCMLTRFSFFFYAKDNEKLGIIYMQHKVLNFCHWRSCLGSKPMLAKKKWYGKVDDIIEYANS